jgi:hypothetical protein
VLNAKGGEIKAKANGSANHLWISKIVELESVGFDQNPLIAKKCSLMGENFRYGKKGSLSHLIKFTLERSLDLPKQVFWYRDRKNNLFCENKPSDGKSDPNMPNPMWDKLVFNLHSLASLWKWCCTLSCFSCVGINHQKRGRLKGKCAIGQFL